MISPALETWVLQGRIIGAPVVTEGPELSCGERVHVAPSSRRQDQNLDEAARALRELEPFLRHTLAEDAPDGGWPYDPDSPQAVNPRIRAALATVDSASDQQEPSR